MTLLSMGLEAVERGIVPDMFTRIAIRRLCFERLRACAEHGPVSSSETGTAELLTSLRTGPIALVPDKANEQHYELPAEFFSTVLGPRRKYSCCFWPSDVHTLAEAEDAALSITCERAGLAEDQDVLELGCGWGSLSLWMAERYPHSRITAVSNSRPQKKFIDRQIERRGLKNLRIVTADMNDFDPWRLFGKRLLFDRVVSVEMFEHMRNYELLLARIASWLRSDGKLFVHHFCHRQFSYPFETVGNANWMGRYFFTGGIMPSRDLLRRFDRHLQVTSEWKWDGTHYERTAEAWLANLDRHTWDVLPILRSEYGAAEARRWLQRWRMFFLAVAELFGCNRGEEWFVSHVLLEPVC